MNFNFNLNDDSLLGNGSIFNGGNAGRVENVSISMARKSETDPVNGPDVNFFYTDNSGGNIKDGYYKFTEDQAKSKEDNEKAARLRLGKLLSIAKCIIPQDFQFPDVTNMSVNQVEETLLNIIHNNATPDKKVNVFVNYGRKSNPQQYLRVRNFNFIEKAGTPANQTRLTVNNNDDNMERITPDAPNANTQGGGFGNIPPAGNNAGGNFWNQ